MSGPTKVLIGYDGSHSADAAIDDLAIAGLPPRLEARVLMFIDLWPHLSEWIKGPEDVRRNLEHLINESDAIAAKAADRLRNRFPGWTVRSETVTDSSYHGLLAAAERWPADLIVLGTHDHNVLRRALLGNIAHAVATHAHCSVRICRAHPRPVPGRAPKLLIATDGSDAAGAVVREVASRTWPKGTEACVVSVLDLRLTTALPVAEGAWAESYGTAGAATPIDTSAGRDLLRNAVTNATDDLARAGLFTNQAIREGDPKRVILDEARSFDADCLFCGASGHAGLDRFLMGSVSSAIAARAPCTVEVVRPHA